MGKKFSGVSQTMSRFRGWIQAGATLPDLSPAARTFLDFLEPHLVEFLSEKS